MKHFDIQFTFDSNKRIYNAFKFIGNAEFSGKKGELRFEKKASKTIVQMDRNGDGNADMEIELTGAMNLQAADFIL